MIIERIHTTQIESTDPKLIYSNNLVESLKQNLTQRYVNRCFQSCYVTEIVEIERYTPPICERERVGGSTRIALTFKFKGIVYDKFEVIPDAKIVQIMDDGRLLCKSKYAAIMLMPNAKLQTFKVGQTIPIRVFQSSYPIFQDQIGVIGIPFIPLITQEKEFAITITESDISSLIGMFETFNTLLETLEKDKNFKKWENFVKPPKEKALDGYKSINIKDIKGSGFVYRKDWTDLTSLDVWFKPQDHEFAVKNSVQVLKGYLNNSIKQLHSTNELMQVFQNEFDNEEWAKLYKSESK